MATPSPSSSDRTKTTNAVRPLRFLLVSILFHLLFTASIFDIYFTSPVVHPTRRYSIQDTYTQGESSDDATFDTQTPPADRLVLIVGDGLRADTLFKEHQGTMLPDWAHGLEPDQLQQAALTLDKQSISTSDSAVASSQQPFFAAPHLRDITLTRGSWGVSHTRVPTESRPGHVALIAGMYEDVSAVTKGWKLNPVDFDSLINVSTHAYTFGSPDILPMFAKGATPGTVDMWMYDDAAEDFTKDAAALDLWVLHRLEELFERAKTDKQLEQQIRAPGNVFFLHLLGLDTTGHTYRPQSPEYVGNLIVVDAIVKRVEELFQDFFDSQDNARTAYVFSADHGMSSKGNHGDGEPENTRTPLVAWGSGVRGPRSINWQDDGQELAHREAEAEQDRNRVKSLAAGGVLERMTARGDPMPEDDNAASVQGYFDNWIGLERLARLDVEQADITTLMATLLGLPLPANSEGRLPLAYLDLTPAQAARAMLTNALEVLEIYRVKHQQRQARTLRYVPFEHLPPQEDDGSVLETGTIEVEMIKEQIANQDYESALQHSQILIDLALQGAQYLQTYDWLLLVCIVSAGYLGSILYGITFLLKTYVVEDEQQRRLSPHSQRGLTLGRILAAPVLAIFFAKFHAESAPVTYYLYLLFTVLYWVRVIDSRDVFLQAYRQSTATAGATMTTTHPRSLIARLALLAIFALASLELMVLGYLHRWAWSLGFFYLGFVWPFLSFNDVQRSKNEGLLLLWGLSCVGCALLTLGGVDKEESMVLLGLSGVVFVIAGVVVISKREWFLGDGDVKAVQRTVTVLKFQVALIVITTLVTLSSSYHLKNKLGLPLLNQIIGWGVLLLTSTVPFIAGFTPRQAASQRLTIIIFSSAPIFIILSLRDEALFFAMYTCMLLLWSKVEGVYLEETLLSMRPRPHLRKGDATSSSSTTTSTSTLLPLPRQMGLSEIRLSLLFLFMLHVGFFGTGNIASISSFYLSPVYRLIPIFSPFAMASLLILKILLPFLILCSIFQFLCVGTPSGRATGAYLPGNEPSVLRADAEQQVKEKRTTSASSRIAREYNGAPLLGPDSIGGLGLHSSHGPIVAASIATDILALNFLFAVKTQGAWLEIGRTITHFAMANLLEVFMFALSAVVAALY